MARSGASGEANASPAARDLRDAPVPAHACAGSVQDGYCTVCGEKFLRASAAYVQVPIAVARRIQIGLGK